MEHISTQSQLELIDEKPTIGSLLEQREVLAKVYEEIDEQRERLQTDDIAAAAEAIFEQYDDDSQSELQILIAHGSEVLPREYYEVIQRYAALEDRFQQVEEALDVLAGKELIEYVQGEVQALLDIVDPRRLTNGMYTDDDKNTIRHLISKLCMILEGDDVSYGWAEACYDELERCQAMLDDFNMLGQAAEVPHPAHQVAYSRRELHYAYMLNKRYRTYHAEVHPDVAYYKPMLPSHEWQTKMTNEQRTTLEHHLRSLDVDKEVARLNIEGIERLPFDYDESELRLFLRRFPAIAFEGVETLSFKLQSEVPEDKQSADLGDGWVNKAQHSHDLSTNTTEITIWLDPCFKAYEKEMSFIEEKVWPRENGPLVETTRADSIDAMKRSVEADIAHEFGHALHYTLPVSLLHEWDEAVRSATDDQPVSHYVKHSKETQHPHADMEEFADTFRLYVAGSPQLQRDASVHYQAMKKIVDSCRS